MLLTENVLRKIIAEEFEKLQNESQAAARKKHQMEAARKHKEKEEDDDETEKELDEGPMRGKAYMRDKYLKSAGITKGNPNNQTVRSTRSSSTKSDDAQIPKKLRSGHDYEEGDD